MVAEELAVPLKQTLNMRYNTYICMNTFYKYVYNFKNI